MGLVRRCSVSHIVTGLLLAAWGTAAGCGRVGYEYGDWNSTTLAGGGSFVGAGGSTLAGGGTSVPPVTTGSSTVSAGSATGSGVTTGGAGGLGSGSSGAGGGGSAGVGASTTAGTTGAGGGAAGAGGSSGAGGNGGASGSSGGSAGTNGGSAGANGGSAGANGGSAGASGGSAGANGSGGASGTAGGSGSGGGGGVAGAGGATGGNAGNAGSAGAPVDAGVGGGSPSGPVLYWKFDEASGTVATDSSGNGFDGTYMGSPQPPSRSTLIPPKVTFTDPASRQFVPAKQQSVRLPNASATLKPTNNVTMTAWYRATATDTIGGTVLSLGDNYLLFLHRASTGTIELAKVQPAADGGSSWIKCTGTAPTYLDGNWHHLAGVISSTGMRLYFDGAVLATNPDTSGLVYPLGLDLFAGLHGNGATGFDFDGNIDDLRIYARALSAAEISQLAQGGVGP